MSEPQFIAAGDSAILVKFGDELSLDTNRKVLAFDRALRNESLAAITEIVPTICSVLISFDPLIVDYQKVEDWLREQLSRLSSDTSTPFTRWRVPACYGGECGPDLAEVAELLGETESSAIEQHSKTRQRVLMLGFAPGFCYCGLLPEQWDIPRLKTVKPNVPSGSISIAVRQTVMTSTSDPTGWRTIARTPFSNFDATKSPPTLICAGDEIVFEPIETADFSRLTELVAKGSSIISSETVD